MTESFAVLSQNYETHEKENALTNPADPATNEEIGTLPDMDVAATRECINAAAEAFKSWSTTTAKVTLLVRASSHINLSSSGTTRRVEAHVRSHARKHGRPGSNHGENRSPRTTGDSVSLFFFQTLENGKPFSEAKVGDRVLRHS